MGAAMETREEFCENIRSCEKSMYHLAFSLLKNESDAGDAVSESIYRAYKSLDTLKNKKAFKAWILRIVHNTAVELIRTNSRLVLTDQAALSVEKHYDPDLAEKITVRQAVAQLKQPYQTVVILFYYENLSVIEISRITGSSIIAVKTQLSRARKMLLELLKEDFAV